MTYRRIIKLNHLLTNQYIGANDNVNLYIFFLKYNCLKPQNLQYIELPGVHLRGSLYITVMIPIRQVAVMSDHEHDRRKEPRHKAESGACAVIDDTYIDVGHIIDISESGMSFIYAGSEIPTHEALDLSIYLYNNDFYIDKIPTRVISNFTIPRQSLQDFVILMRCCLQFDNLSEQQRNQIEFLIKNYTHGYA